MRVKHEHRRVRTYIGIICLLILESILYLRIIIFLLYSQTIYGQLVFFFYSSQSFVI